MRVEALTMARLSVSSGTSAMSRPSISTEPDSSSRIRNSSNILSTTKVSLWASERHAPCSDFAAAYVVLLPLPVRPQNPVLLPGSTTTLTSSSTSGNSGR